MRDTPSQRDLQHQLEEIRASLADSQAERWQDMHLKRPLHVERPQPPSWDDSNGRLGG